MLSIIVETANIFVVQDVLYDALLLISKYRHYIIQNILIVFLNSKKNCLMIINVIHKNIIIYACHIILIITFTQILHTHSKYIITAATHLNQNLMYND